MDRRLEAKIRKGINEFMSELSTEELLKMSITEMFGDAPAQINNERVANASRRAGQAFRQIRKRQRKRKRSKTRKKMSASARKAISKRMKEYWSERRKKTKTK